MGGWVGGCEYFYNWWAGEEPSPTHSSMCRTGNRVTLNNWFQLTLKEGLTVYRDQSFTAGSSSVQVVVHYPCW